MRTILLSSAAALVLIGGAVSAEPGGNGRDNPKGSARNDVRDAPKAQTAKKGGDDARRDNGKAQVRADTRTEARVAARSEERGPERQADRRQDNKRDDRAAKAEVRRDDRVQAERGNERGNDRVVVRNQPNVTIVQREQRSRPLPVGVRRVEYSGPAGKRFFVPTSERVRVVTTRRDFDWARVNRDRRYINGCPPGLAKKYNGCMPPGLARPVSYRWAQPDWYGRDWDRQVRYRYMDGYLLRLGSGDRIMSYVPLLGGALAIGQVWPSVSYQPVTLPNYYSQYYRLGGASDYRYYGNTIYRVDPQTSAIGSVAALLTGDDFTIGQPMPVGYQVYNVPYNWRGQYADGPDAYYRYSDGYIYQIDPTTRLVQAAIELLL